MAREPIADQSFLRMQQISSLTDPGIRRANNRRYVLQNNPDRPTWIPNISVPTHYERLARGRPQFDKFIIKPQESRTREDIEVEYRFEDGVKRITAVHRDKRFQPLARRTPLLIDREFLPIN